MEPDEGPDEHLEGRFARVTVPVPVGEPGEVVVEVRGAAERYQAWSDVPIPKHAPVVIVKVRPDGSVDVVPFSG